MRCRFHIKIAALSITNLGIRLSSLLCKFVDGDIVVTDDMNTTLQKGSNTIIKA